MTTTAQLSEPETGIDDIEIASGTAESDVPEAARRWTPPSRGVLVAACAATLLAVAVGASAVLGWQLQKVRVLDQAAQQAKAAAEHYAVVLTSIGGADVDRNFTAVMDGATGEFKDMYSKSSAQLKQVLIDSKAKADGKVIAAAVNSATPDKVEVMLFVDQSVTNVLNPQPRWDRSRILMTMDKVDGRWLASKVELP